MLRWGRPLITSVPKSSIGSAVSPADSGTRGRRRRIALVRLVLALATRRRSGSPGGHRGFRQERAGRPLRREPGVTSTIRYQNRGDDRSVRPGRAPDPGTIETGGGPSVEIRRHDAIPSGGGSPRFVSPSRSGCPPRAGSGSRDTVGFELAPADRAPTVYRDGMRHGASPLASDSSVPPQLSGESVNGGELRPIGGPSHLGRQSSE